MCVIIEKEFKNDEIRMQFTSCCGASDKGTEYGVVCRGCYSPIQEYWNMEDADKFTELFETEGIYAKWFEFVEQPEFNTWEKWHDWRIELLYGKEVA